MAGMCGYCGNYSCVCLMVRAGALCVLLVLIGACPGLARVSGPCSNCHTMHYSQNNTLLAAWDEGGPHQALLRSDCVGCHTGINSDSSAWDTPYVMCASGAPLYSATGTEGDTTTLAGGSFYWVTQPAVGAVGGEASGHNVAGLANRDTQFSTPPGFNGGRAASDGSTPGNGVWPADQQVTCAGTYGCHGTHFEAVQTAAIRGAHHGDLGGARTGSGTDPAAGYRFLVGIEGYEDADWEFRPTRTAHNQYKGLDTPETTDTSTISSLCARCHGAYHDGSGNVGSASPWLRHPTDYDLGNADSSEYGAYGGAGNLYNPAVPVASESVSVIRENITFSNDAIVTCVSCHRAHGSKYYKAMRWDYAGSITGGLCSECHSSKD